MTVILDHFFHFYHTGDIILLHICTINEICLAPETRGTTDRMFCQFGPFFALLHSLVQTDIVIPLEKSIRYEVKREGIGGIYIYNQSRTCLFSQQYLVGFHEIRQKMCPFLEKQSVC